MKLTQWMKRSGLAWLGLCLAGGVLVGLVFYVIQKAQAAEFKAYSLSHVQAGQIQTTLEAILPQGTELLVDSQKNRILISGSAQAHQIAQQAIASLDRPPAPPTPKKDTSPEKPQPAQPVMAAYACADGTVEQTAQRLRTQWADQGEVRIVADPRTSQVLVLAPPEIQRQIAAQLGQSTQAAAKPTTAGRSGTAASGVFQNTQAAQVSQTSQIANSHNISPPAVPPSPHPKTTETSSVIPPPQVDAQTSPPPSSPHAPSAGEVRQTQTVQLWQTHASAMESALVEMLGNRMQPVGSGQYRLHVSGGRELMLRFDTQTDRIVVQGTPSAVEASVRLLYALDTPPDASGMRTHVMPLSSASSEHFQRAVRAIQTSQKLPTADRNALNGETGENRELGESEGNRKVDSTGSNPFRLAQAGVPGGAAPGGGTPAGPEPAAPAGADPGGPVPSPPAGPAPPTTPGAPIVPGGAAPGGPESPAPGAAAQPGAEPGQPGPEGAEKPAVMGPVQVQLLEGLDVLVIRGLRRDVEQVLSVIQQIEQLARVTEPVIEIYQLRYVDCEAVTTLVQQLYTAIYEPRQGIVSVTALVKPNALLLIGPRGNVDKVLNLVRKLDRPVPPETQFRVFRLKHASAETVQAQIQEFYSQRGGLGVRVIVTSDFRSNSLVVMARPRDMVEIAALIERLDTDTSEAEHEIRVFKLQNTLAEDLAPILQSAIGAGEGAARAPGQAAQPPGQAAARAGAAETKSTILSFVTVDAQGRRLLKSGILTGVRITADTRSNSLVVSAPAQNMPLLEALIRQLDVLPAAEAQIKVFTIVNGDASSLAEMLQALFATQAGGAAAGGVQLQNVAVQGESSLTPLRFAVDVRTNSIIAVGAPGFLTVVEAILLRLDEADVRARKSLVYRLRNAPASDVANALNEFLRSERQVQQAAPGLVSAFEQIEREVVVVPEIVSNSLIVSATPRFYDEIVRLIEDLDKRPPMVLIQVLIAEVTLNNVDEFGVELGLQDSILFDRSILNNIVTRSIPTTLPNGTQTTTQEIISANIEPGFNFNNQPLGNSGATKSLQHADVIGTQGLSHFGVGRLNSELGFGGLVLSASSESVSILLRALKDSRRMDILARPQLMTLDNQPAFIQVGQEVPTIRGVTINETGQVNNVDYASVGLILGVTPRISPDGLVVMEIDAVKSEVGPEAEGIPISISATGEIIRSPRINTTRAQTTVSALNAQTIVLGGLITRSSSKIHRRVPVLSDIPVVGNLFRYDNVTAKRTELLIIMTPHIVNNEQDADRVRQMEAARMSWCLGDVVKIHGDAGLRGRSDDWGDDEVAVVYPDLHPTADRLPPCRGRLRQRAERWHFPQNRLEPRRDLAPISSACEGPECRPRTLVRVPADAEGQVFEGVPEGSPESLQPTPVPGGAAPTGQGLPPEAVPTPPSEPMSAAPPMEHGAFSASAAEFLPQEKNGARPWEKLRSRLARKNEPTTPASQPEGTVVIEKPFSPQQEIPVATGAR